MKTHVHPLEYAAATTHGEQLESVHRPARNDTACWDHTCTYEDLPDADRAMNERAALGILTREGMAQKALARRLSAPTATVVDDVPRAQLVELDCNTRNAPILPISDGGYVLPASLVKGLPDNEYSIDRYKTHPGTYRSEGPGWTARLTRDGKPVADLQYNGDGGDTRVEWYDSKGWSWLPLSTFVTVPGGDARHASSQQHAEFLLWVDRCEGVWSAEYNLSWSFDGVIATLVEEASLTKSLNGTRTRIPVLVGDAPADGISEWGTYGGGKTKPTVADTLAYFAKRGEQVRVWVDGAWRTASELVAA